MTQLFQLIWRMKEVFTLVIGILCLLHIKAASGECDMKDLGDAINSFAIDLFKELLLGINDNVDGNIFFSPFSISTALAMTQLGTAGETSQQMERTLKFNRCPNYHKVFGHLLDDINAMNKDYTLKSANGLFPNNQFNIDQTYVDNVIMYYKTQIKTYDNTNEASAAVDDINKWIAENTENKLKNVLSPSAVNAQTMLLLINAIYFKGDWKYLFERTRTRCQKFDAPGEKIKVDMMIQRFEKKHTHVYLHDNDLDAHILELPYKGDDVSMVIILPDIEFYERDKDTLKALKDLEANLTAFKLGTIQGQLDSHNFSKPNVEVNLEFPRFQIEWKSDLVGHLEHLGMLDVFSDKPSVANFSRMCEKSTEQKCDLHVDKVIHQAFVEVNEKGTEAAAVSTVVARIVSGPGPVQFKADKPFLFLIRHKKSSTILFMGHVTKPTGTKTACAKSCMTREPCMKIADGSPAIECCGCQFKFKDPTKRRGKPQNPRSVLKKLKKKCNGEDCRESCLTEKCFRIYEVTDSCKVKNKKPKNDKK